MEDGGLSLWGLMDDGNGWRRQKAAEEGLSEEKGGRWRWRKVQRRKAVGREEEEGGKRKMKFFFNLKNN